uniref:Tryptophan synthase beta chain-like PALP domain-containing protein n=1 Tax=Vannella robusta TaxID=1487602 RepID=A0A7S4I2W9_9EUKA|mmetsp:Transcript_19687/g.24873  ORF Transcript_19687/g.24873 Transcript_19687/m.24873 type:complete len:160 (+) Transcript_19687:366-845(+)
MGQGVAWMVNYLNQSPTKFAEEILVVAPDHLPEAKHNAMKRMGVRCILVPFSTWWTLVDQQAFHGVEEKDLPPDHFSFHPELRQHLENDKEQWENIFVHPVFDTNVMAGNGTIALEVFEDLPSLDAVIIPYGGGALSCGIAAGIRVKKPDARMYVTAKK